MKRLILICLSLCVSAFAEPYYDELTVFLDPGIPDPANRVHVEGTYGTGDYYSTGVDAQIAFSKFLSFVGGGYYVQSSPGYTSGSGYMGIDYFDAGVWGARVTALGQSGPGEVSAFGASLDGHVYLNQLWQGKAATILDASVSGQQYRFDLPGPAGRPAPRTQLVQTRLLLGLTQELHPTLFVGVSASLYRYDMGVDQLNRAINNARLQFPAVVGTIQGFPLNVLAMRARWSFLPDWAIEPSLSATQVATTNSRATAFGVLLQHAFTRDFILGLRGTYLKSSTGAKDGLGTLEIDYLW